MRRDRGGHPVRPDAAPHRGLRRRAARRAEQPRRRAVLLRAAQRQAAVLLGHRRRPAVQDPQQPQHPGRLPAAAAVRPADRPGDAGPRGRRRARRRRDRQRPQPAAAAGPVPGPGQPGAGDLPGGQVARRRSCSSAIEKKDAEALTVLRARQERVVLELAEVVRYQAWQEAIKATEALEASLANAVVRYTHYEKLLGKDDSDIVVPELDELDTDALERMRFSAQEPAVATRDGLGRHRRRTRSPRRPGTSSAPRRPPSWTSWPRPRTSRRSAAAYEKIGSVLGDRSRTSASTSTPIGIGAVDLLRRQQLSRRSSAAWPAIDRSDAGQLTFEAGQSARIAGYARREQDWALQSNAAAGEITMTFKQLRAAQIRAGDGRARVAQPPAADPQRTGDRAVPHRRADRQDQPTRRSTAGCAARRAASTRAASSSPSTPRARPNARCSTSWATRAAPSCSTTTWPAARSCSPGSGCTSTSSAWSWPTTSSTGASTS